MTPADRGRKGGRKTLERHGRAHFAALGKLGFAALARKLGTGRKGALLQLQHGGRMAAPPDVTPGQMAALERSVGLADDTDTIPY